ncbi:MAG: PPC domain-containing protein [Verrucomicrobiota bacterium]
MNSFRITILALFAACIGAAEAASPALNNILPRGGQRGQETPVTFYGERLGDTKEVIFYDSGITAKNLAPAEDGKTLKATLVVAPNAPLGEHQLRLQTKGGLTYVRSFWIGPFAAVAEKEPNNEFESPQAVPTNHTIEGVAANEDVDYYQIEAKKGDRISLEVEAIRLGQMFDPYIALLNKDRFEIAISDDSALNRQDGVLSIVAPEDGPYIIEVRESSYKGNNNYRYRLHVGNFPRPTAIYPAGGKAGSELNVTLLGDPKGPIKQKVKLPGAEAETHDTFAAPNTPSPNTLRVSAFDNALEVEPNNDAKSATKVDKPLPVALNGILEKDGDQDFFRITAKKGQKFRVRALGKAINSPVDPTLAILDKDGKQLQSNDDADGGADSRIDYTFPEDGEYLIRVRDMLLRGGEDFVYRVETKTFSPELTLTMPEFERRNNQIRKAMVAHQGNRYATVVNVNRKNFNSEVAFDIPGLPKGMTWKSGKVPPGMTSFPIVFYAAADAPIGGKLVDLNARSLDEKVKVEGKYSQPVDFVRGNPNQAIYYESANDRLPVAVAEPAPYKIDIEKPAVPLVQNGVLPLKVKVTRNEGFDGKVLVRMLWKSPGISANPTITIAEGKNEGLYNLTANGEAKTGDWNYVVLAESDTPKGKVYASSDFQTVTVEPGFLSGKFELTTAEQGQTVNLVCPLEKARDFEGKASVTLLGLPAKATAEPVQITKDTKELKFTVKVDPETPKGQHKNLYCQLSIPKNNTSIVQSFARGGILRVDPKPEPEPEPKPAPKPAAAEKKPAEPKKEEPKKVASK